jgi:hypothetical protein
VGNFLASFQYRDENHFPSAVERVILGSSHGGERRREGE